MYARSATNLTLLRDALRAKQRLSSFDHDRRWYRGIAAPMSPDTLRLLREMRANGAHQPPTSCATRHQPRVEMASPIHSWPAALNEMNDCGQVT